MSVTPAIKLVAYEDRTPGFVFVAVPDERGRYMRTDKSVPTTPCSLCGAIAGEPCFRLIDGIKSYSSSTHAVRRSAAKTRYYGRYKEAGDVLHDEQAPMPSDINLIEPRVVEALV
jgi:hypothetical protein